MRNLLDSSLEHSDIVELASGLGNQLFQLAYGLSLATDETVVLSNFFEGARCNENGGPEIDSFTLPSRVSVIGADTTKRSVFSRLISRAGVTNRLRMLTSANRQTGYKNRIQRIAYATILEIYFRFSREIEVARNLGYYRPRVRKRSSFHIGFFQSYGWASVNRVRSELLTISPKIQSQSLLDLKNWSKQERPLIVHVRLGDYKSIANIGVLTADYYRKAITLAISAGGFERVWIFSDEIELAKTLLPIELLGDCRWIQEIGDSTSETFEAMRYGHSYIIANSTFSWWAAFLSHSLPVQVIAPSPWFKIVSEPKDLIPPNWIRIDGHGLETML